MTEFEKFALDHRRHQHCIGCGGCILDRRLIAGDFFNRNVQQVNPLWCVGCSNRLRESPRGIPSGAMDFTQPGVLLGT